MAGSIYTVKNCSGAKNRIGPESYRHDIQAVINMVLIGWLQLRNTYVDLKERKEHGHEAK